jgi:selenide,water dikinase
LPQYQLGELLGKAGLTADFGEDVLAGPWENSSVVKIADGIAVLNTLDFFTPMVDEPEIQGRIAGSNVTSDIYALAVTKIVSVLSIIISCRIAEGVWGFLPRDGCTRCWRSHH